MIEVGERDLKKANPLAENILWDNKLDMMRSLIYSIQTINYQE